MQYHKLTEHFDEKPFSCEECGAKFAANSTLKNHQRLHTGDQPFACKHCLMSFAQASALAYHTKKKHAKGEARCPSGSASDCSYLTGVRKASKEPGALLTHVISPCTPRGCISCSPLPKCAKAPQ